MLETIEEICGDRISRKILNLLADGWTPIKLLIPKLEVDRHTVYGRLKALEKHDLIERSKRKDKASRYKLFGFNLTERGKILVLEDKTIPSISLKFTMHSFEHNFLVSANLYVYPNSKAPMLNSNAAKYHLSIGTHNMLMELTRDPDVNLGNCRLIFDCKFQSIAEVDVYEFYSDYLSPSLRSYVENRTFWAEKGLAVRISESPNSALELIKLTRFTAINYSDKIGKENIELIKVALDGALEEVKTKSTGWAYKVSSLIINAYLFMLASIYQLEGQLPEPERYFELWYLGIRDLEKLEMLYSPLRGDLQRKLSLTKNLNRHE